MKKRIKALALLAATLLAPSLWAANGTMKLSGRLTENACEIVSKNITADSGSVLQRERGC